MSRKGAIPTTLRRARKKARVTQSQLASRLGCQRTWVSKIENGVCEPTIQSLIRIGDALGIPAWNLLWKVQERMKAANE